MEMSLGQVLRLGQDMELCQSLTGGWTRSIFPKVEMWLEEDSDRWKALRFIGSKKSMERYRSVVDYLYAQVFPERRAEVFRFYLSGDEAHMAKELITVRGRAVMEAKLLIALEVAYQLWVDNRAASWKQVRELIEELAA